MFGSPWPFRRRRTETDRAAEAAPETGFADLFGQGAMGRPPAPTSDLSLDPPPPPSLDGTSFDHILSLGSDCDVALQLRRVGWLRTPSVFDWLITPWDSMVAVLEDNGARLAREFYASHNGGGAACAAYHLAYWHEFPRDAQSKVQVTREAADQARGKLTHKLARMRTACDGPGTVLFVRSGIVTDAAVDRFGKGAAFPAAELDRCAGLIAKQHPTLQFMLLCIAYDGFDLLEPALPSDPRVHLHRMAVASPRERTRASDAEWDQLFAQVRYKPRTGSKPIEEKLVE